MRFSVCNQESNTINAPLQLKKFAYLEYLREFSQDGMNILQKLQSQFNSQIKTKFEKNINSIKDTCYSEIQSLLTSYQILIMEINDSCQFVEVKQFGHFLMKVFLQLVQILKWNLKQNQSYLKFIQENSFKDTFQQPSNFCIFQDFEEPQTKQFEIKVSKNYKRSSMYPSNVNEKIQSLRSRFARVSDNHLMRRQSKANVPLTRQSQMLFIKQKIPFQLKELDLEISQIEREYKSERNQNQNHINLLDLDKSISQIQTSNNQQILTQIISNLLHKGQAIDHFVDSRKKYAIQNIELQQNSAKYYETINNQIAEQMKNSLQLAKAKLLNLFKEQIDIHGNEKRKQNAIISGQFYCQAQEDEILAETQSPADLKLTKSRQKWIIKGLREELKILENKFQYQKHLRQSLEKLLSVKSNFYEQEQLKYRNQLISLEVKNRKELKQLRNGKFSNFKEPDGIRESIFIEEIQRNGTKSTSSDQQNIEMKGYYQFASKKYVRGRTNKKLRISHEDNQLQIQSNLIEVYILPISSYKFTPQTTEKGINTTSLSRVNYGMQARPPTTHQVRQKKKHVIKNIDYNKTEPQNTDALFMVKKSAPLLKNIQFNLGNKSIYFGEINRQFESNRTHLMSTARSSSSARNQNNKIMLELVAEKQNIREENKQRRQKNINSSTLVQKIMRKYQFAGIENSQQSKKGSKEYKMNFLKLSQRKMLEEKNKKNNQMMDAFETLEKNNLKKTQQSNQKRQKTVEEEISNQDLVMEFIESKNEFIPLTIFPVDINFNNTISEMIKYNIHKNDTNNIKQ